MRVRLKADTTYTTLRAARKRIGTAASAALRPQLKGCATLNAVVADALAPFAAREPLGKARSRAGIAGMNHGVRVQQQSDALRHDNQIQLFLKLPERRFVGERVGAFLMRLPQGDRHALTADE